MLLVLQTPSREWVIVGIIAIPPSKFDTKIYLRLSKTSYLFLCEQFIANLYEIKFEISLGFSYEALNVIYPIGNWYVNPDFNHIIIFGPYNGFGDFSSFLKEKCIEVALRTPLKRLH